MWIDPFVQWLDLLRPPLILIKVIHNNNKAKMQNWLFNYFSFQSSNFQFCQFSLLIFNLYQCKIPLNPSYGLLLMSLKRRCFPFFIFYSPLLTTDYLWGDWKKPTLGRRFSKPVVNVDDNFELNFQGFKDNDESDIDEEPFLHTEVMHFCCL